MIHIVPKHLRRVSLLLAGLIFTSGTALAFSLEIAGAPQPTEMICPRFIAPPTTPQGVARPEETETPTQEEIEEVMELPAPALAQRIQLGATHRSGVPSIGIWGDSHLAAGFFTDELVNLLGLSKSAVKPGFLPPTMGRPGVRLPIRKYCKSPGWRFANAYVARGEMLKVGPALTTLEAMRDEVTLWIDFRLPQENAPALDQLTVHFREIAEQSVELELQIDDGPAQMLTLEKGERQLQLIGTQPFSQLKLRLASGTLAIEGFIPGYVTPGQLRLDIFGIPGATVRSWKVIDPNYLRERLTTPEYDLVVLEYGTNEGADRNFDPETYRNGLDASLRGLKSSFPNAQCLLIGPTDRGVLVKKHRAQAKKPALGKNARKEKPRAVATRVELLKYAHVHARISEIQQNLATAYGCASWNWQQAMGGPGGAYKWFYKAQPWMARDLIHLTHAGYQESARLFFEATAIGEWLK